MSGCRCPKVELLGPEGEQIESRSWPDPGCPMHGRPKDKWRVNDPLQRHARIIDRETGEALTREEGRRRLGVGEDEAVDGAAWQCRFRDERPSETEARLFGELRGVA